MRPDRKRDPLDDGWLSLNGAARELGRTRMAVLRYALQGVLVSETKAGRTVISRESVERLARDLQGAS